MGRGTCSGWRMASWRGSAWTRSTAGSRSWGSRSAKGRAVFRRRSSGAPLFRRLLFIPVCALAAAAPASAASPHAVLRHAEAVMHGQAAKQGAEPTAALKELATRLSSLQGEARVRARRMLLRPSDGAQPGETAYTVP